MILLFQKSFYYFSNDQVYNIMKIEMRRDIYLPKLPYYYEKGNEITNVHGTRKYVFNLNFKSLRSMHLGV